jgi:DNA-binding response OmpR family regulator
MRALVVEDDTVQFEYVQEKLMAAFVGLDIVRVSTECEFRSKFEAIAANPPDVAVIDVMLRWTDATADYVARPAEVRVDNGHYRAGFRCAAMLAANANTRDVPVIIYSVLDVDDVQAQIRQLGPKHYFIRKESYIGNLTAQIRAVLGRDCDA